MILSAGVCAWKSSFILKLMELHARRHLLAHLLPRDLQALAQGVHFLHQVVAPFRYQENRTALLD
jgi:hypothetical protein